MKRLFSILILLLFMAFGVAIAIVNAEEVVFNYYYGSVTQPLSILLVGAIMVGAILATLINSLVILSLRHQVRRAQRQLKKLDENSVTLIESSESKN
ncbi:MAG: LapA family protein [gamma proteobacterium symbiont of Bathyaustriella thionipta]|nr:LapA family protein [gamma proteobacterium symbiont of Bathyaustriella thionipta]MCU7949231.1 LapA family protein [gamma proteobacterium symbiont of Bathyaustriella thionipta]MCU7954809.1 LapA family protein [gamma proteobacterium symbiont of Bathyaustriella thionipta]MCU7955827.1 LapA family protein [gamma proteobacterium symbiont of Bathyaustriella thionipta]MCU7967256.1 LapA family protein [gamma proteobacterium symbiont of Bathyaustriella thionipta]